MKLQRFATWQEAMDECAKWDHDCVLLANSVGYPAHPWTVVYRGDVDAIRVEQVPC